MGQNTNTPAPMPSRHPASRRFHSTLHGVLPRSSAGFTRIRRLCIFAVRRRSPRSDDKNLPSHHEDASPTAENATAVSENQGAHALRVSARSEPVTSGPMSWVRVVGNAKFAHRARVPHATRPPLGVHTQIHALRSLLCLQAARRRCGSATRPSRGETGPRTSPAQNASARVRDVAVAPLASRPVVDVSYAMQTRVRRARFEEVQGKYRDLDTLLAVDSQVSRLATCTARCTYRLPLRLVRSTFNVNVVLRTMREPSLRARALVRRPAADASTRRNLRSRERASTARRGGRSDECCTASIVVSAPLYESLLAPRGRPGSHLQLCPSPCMHVPGLRHTLDPVHHTSWDWPRSPAHRIRTPGDPRSASSCGTAKVSSARARERARPLSLSPVICFPSCC